MERNVYYCHDYSWTYGVFVDRLHAGKLLARFIEQVLGPYDGVIVGLAAGGIPVAYAVALELKIPLDVVVVKKITFPWTMEAGFGAVALNGSVIYDEGMALSAGYTTREVSDLAHKIRGFVVERTLKLRGSLDYGNLAGRNIILVDDGIATGYTMAVAADFLAKKGVREVVVAAPTASTGGSLRVSEKASKVLVLNLRAGFMYAVADAYLEWHDVSDEEALKYVRGVQAGGGLPPTNAL